MLDGFFTDAAAREARLGKLNELKADRAVTAQSSISKFGRDPNEDARIAYDAKKSAEAKKRKLTEEYEAARKWGRMRGLTDIEKFGELLKSFRQAHNREAIIAAESDPDRKAALQALHQRKNEIAQRPQPSRSPGRFRGPSR